MAPAIIPVVEESQVFAARRAGQQLAGQLGWDETTVGKLAIVLSEAATNLVKHAKQGEVHLRTYRQNGTTGIEILAFDRGPGIPRVEVCLADGYSTTRTAGTGLGAIQRLSNHFDIYSQQGKGTCLVARISPPSTEVAPRPRQMCLGCVQVPIHGETECGDDWGIRHAGDITVVMAADGLGHGRLAAEASGAAVAAFERTVDTAPEAILSAVHQALRSTRGAAVAVAQIDSAKGQIRFAGVGNISAVLLTASTQQHMISHNGTAGHNVRRIQEFQYPWTPRTKLVMHSDGINTSWRLDSYPGVAAKDPSLLAALLLRDASRVRDDACVLVVCDGD